MAWLDFFVCLLFGILGVQNSGKAGSVWAL